MNMSARRVVAIAASSATREAADKRLTLVWPMIDALLIFAGDRYLGGASPGPGAVAGFRRTWLVGSQCGDQVTGRGNAVRTELGKEIGPGPGFGDVQPDLPGGAGDPRG
jgi:hypothetical protein